MSYATPAQLRSYGLISRRIQDTTEYPDATLQHHLDHANGRINGYLNSRYQLPVESTSLLVSIELIGASWYMITSNGLEPDDQTQVLYNLYLEYYGPDGILKQIANGEFDIGLTDSTNEDEGAPEIILSYASRGSKNVDCDDGETEYI